MANKIIETTLNDLLNGELRAIMPIFRRPHGRRNATSTVAINSCSAMRRKSWSTCTASSAS